VRKPLGNSNSGTNFRPLVILLAFLFGAALSSFVGREYFSARGAFITNQTIEAGEPISAGKIAAVDTIDSLDEALGCRALGRLKPGQVILRDALQCGPIASRLGSGR